MDSMSGDRPYWSGSNEATFKEMWVEPVSRFLGTVSAYAMEGQNASKSGSRMEPVVTDVDRGSKGLKVNFTVAGEGRHTIGVRAFNAEGDEREKAVEAAAGQAVTIEWEFRVADAERPWVMVFAVDGDWSKRGEVVGAFVSGDVLD
jgi:hypothetical protein